MRQPSRYCDVCDVEGLFKIDDNGMYGCKEHFRECEWCGGKRVCDSYDGEYLCIHCYEDCARWCVDCNGLRYYEDVELIEGDDMCCDCLEINVRDGNVKCVENEGYVYVENKEGGS